MSALVNPIAAHTAVQLSSFNLDQLKKIKVSENFTWAEVFTNRSLYDIKTASLQIYINAQRTAERLEAIRRFLRQKTGKPIVLVITSWYRSPAANTAAGGVNGSQHTLALAADFIVPGYADKRGNQYIQALLIEQKDSIRFCLELTNGSWTHIDLRPSNLVFENKGNNNYPVLTFAQRNAFVAKYGKAA